MRDRKRITAVLDALRQAWERKPDLRLGQLLVIAAQPKEPCSELFYIEDHVLLQGIENYHSHLKASDGVEVVLGPEFDTALMERLRRWVHTEGGRMSEGSFGVGGSQELTRYDVILPTGDLVVTSETYVGLSIRGPEELVRAVCLAVQSA
ncbi:hypothetical protein [Niveibacterium microcysteis]|uniref:Uncharacterized protein n=1 Tax=Niveibacterium microcysteis TaxID=2811415 RepID=A0ABX7M4G8_9RHOO|nr:hypothetical protein [Niveibacterium microcysteis]QSI76641.1 hypothetical protein JY500_19620 [Niveibacterium microcysteis]